MARLMRHQMRSVEPVEFVDPRDLFGPIDRTFERVFGMWPSLMPFRLPMLAGRHEVADGFIPVDEFQEDGALIIKAELPGIDPDKDVELTVSEGMLHIAAERLDEETVEKDGYVRREMHRGSFERTLPLPAGVCEADVSASYKDGILEIRVPTPESAPATKIQITKS